MAEREALIRSFGFELVQDRSEVPEEDEDISKSFSDVVLVLGEGSDLGLGTVHVTTRRLIWLSNTDLALGVAVSFQSISLHAISQADQVHQKPCIYMQLEAGPSLAAEEPDSEQEEEDEDCTAEARLVPAESSILQDLFQALCESAAMNPDSGQDNDGEGEFFYDEDEVIAGVSGDEHERAEMLDHLDSLLQMPRAADLDELLAEDPERFEDAEEADIEDEGTQHPNGHGKLS